MARTYPPPVERLAARLVRVGSGCLEWTGATLRGGYGVIEVDGRQEKTHRLAWILTNGPIPDGLGVLHRCDNPPCGDPEHLFLGTNADNNADCRAKGRAAPMSPAVSAYWRAKTRCPAGHEYTGENLRINPDGSRECRACHAARERVRRAARKLAAA